MQVWIGTTNRTGEWKDVVFTSRWEAERALQHRRIVSYGVDPLERCEVCGNYARSADLIQHTNELCFK